MTATRDRAPVPLPAVPAAPRREFAKCETPWCRTILAEWRDNRRHLHIAVPAVVPLDGHAPITIVCPHCGHQRLIERR